MSCFRLITKSFTVISDFTSYLCCNYSNIFEMMYSCGYFLGLQIPPPWLCLPCLSYFSWKTWDLGGKQPSQASHSSGKSLWELTWRALGIPVALFTITPAISARVEHWQLSQYPWRCRHVVIKLVSPEHGSYTLFMVPDVCRAFSLSSLLLFFFPLGAAGLDGTEEACVVREVIWLCAVFQNK